MSATMHQLRVAVTSPDLEHWAPAELAAYEASAADYSDDWIYAQVRDVLQAALDAWAAQHPSLVACEPMVM